MSKLKRKHHDLIKPFASVADQKSSLALRWWRRYPGTTVEQFAKRHGLTFRAPDVADVLPALMQAPQGICKNFGRAMDLLLAKDYLTAMSIRDGSMVDWFVAIDEDAMCSGGREIVDRLQDEYGIRIVRGRRNENPDLAWSEQWSGQ